MDDRFGALTFIRVYSGKLDKGMTPAEAHAALAAEPLTHFDVSESLRGIGVDVYNMSRGDGYDTYYLMYEWGELIYWGYPHEFARNKNRLIQMAGKQANYKWYHFRQKE